MSVRKTAAPLLATILVALSFLEGCAGPGTRQIFNTMTPRSSDDCDHNSTDIYFAQELCGKYLGKSAAEADSDNQSKIDFSWAALNDSEIKCKKFVDLFTGAQAGENTVFDLTSLILSGLASVFTPANTVRGLAAGATAIQGSKQAVNSDLFQQMTMLLLVQQIDSVYYAQRTTIINSIPHSKEDAANFSAEATLAQIESMHRYCSIPFAAAAIANQGKTPTTTSISGSITSITNVKIAGAVTTGDAVTLTAKSSSTGFPISVTHTVTAGNNFATIAKDLRDRIYNNPVLAKAGVSATPPDPDLVGAGSVQFTLQGGPADLTWEAASSAPPPVGGGATPSGTETLTVTLPSKNQ